ncbi:MAG: sigma-70 family RNA polymerase sigma factor [Polyangiaceae bacterium]
MIDFRSPSALAAMAALQNPRTYAVLVGFARWFAGNPFDAKDLVVEALLEVSDPEKGRPWDPGRGSLLTHLRMVIRDLGRAMRDRAKTHRFDPLETIQDAVVSPERNPEQAAARAEELERLVRLAEELRRRLALRSERTLAVFDLICGGVERAADIAEHLGCPVEQVYDANRQIAYHAAQVSADDEAEQEAKTALLRAKMNEDRDSASTLERSWAPPTGSPSRAAPVEPRRCSTKRSTASSR